jgi:hypothetical protein
MSRQDIHATRSCGDTKSGKTDGRGTNGTTPVQEIAETDERVRLLQRVPAALTATVG